MNTLGYQYELNLIRVIDFSYSELKFAEGFNPDEQGKYDWGVNTGFIVNELQEVIFITLYYKLSHSATDEHFVSIGVATAFRINNFKEKMDQGGKLIIEPSFAATLLGITYSTLRGIWHEKLRDTAVSNFILPVIDPTTINYTVEYQ